MSERWNLAVTKDDVRRTETQVTVLKWQHRLFFLLRQSEAFDVGHSELTIVTLE